MAKISLSDWQTEALRHTAFLTNPCEPTSMNLWESLVGEPPDERNDRPRQQLVKEEGPFLNGRLSVVSRKDRIDWRLSYDPKSSAEKLPVVGPYSTLQTKFQELMQRWTTQCRPVKRLAYGTVLLLPTKNLYDANRKLDDLLPAVEIDSENTHDFHYRINRRRKSRCGVEGLEINRLSTWSAVNLSKIDVEISSGGEQRIMRSNDIFCRLELDINTAPGFSLNSIEKDSLSEIFNELVELGNKIASEGDIP